MSQPGGRRRRPLYPMAWGAGTKAFEGVKQQQDDEERQRQEIETNHRRERAIYRSQQGGAGANKKGRMNSELQRKIEEHYHSMSNEADQNQQHRANIDGKRQTIFCTLAQCIHGRRVN